MNTIIAAVSSAVPLPDKKKIEAADDLHENESEEAVQETKETPAVVVDSSKSARDKKDQDADYYQKVIETYQDQVKQIKKAMAKSNKNISYDAYADLSILTSAETIGQVRRFRGRLSAKAHRLKTSGGNPEQIKAVLIKIQKVLSKASTKLKRLIKEDELKKKKKSAELSSDKERELKLERELLSKRRNRRSKEQNDLAEAAAGRGVNQVTVEELKSFSSSRFYKELESSEVLPDTSGADITDSSAEIISTDFLF